MNGMGLEFGMLWLSGDGFRDVRKRTVRRRFSVVLFARYICDGQASQAIVLTAVYDNNVFACHISSTLGFVSFVKRISFIVRIIAMRFKPYLRSLVLVLYIMSVLYS